jgi:hypothetical protein
MAWARLDDGFFDHPKVEGLSNAAFRAYVGGLCLCNRHLTDGVLTRKQVAKLASAKVRGDLVTAKLWDKRDDGGVDVHDFDDYNRDAETVKAERKRNAERQKRWKEKQRLGEANGVNDGVSNTDPSRPVPTRPDAFESVNGKAVVPTTTEKAAEKSTQERALSLVQSLADSFKPVAEEAA